MPHRYYVVTPDCVEAIGLDDLVVAEKATLGQGEGTFLVDTQGVSYWPSLQTVQGGKLAYLGLGHIDHRQGLSRSLTDVVRKGSPPMARAFLAKGADPDASDAHGAPAIVWAVASGNAVLVRMLIAAGADVNRPDSGGITALALADRQRKQDIAQMLRAAGAV